MKNAKVISAKRSFFMSVLSLVLCFAMLLGTTYAWFTDEVTSGVNQIKAGNLDIEVEYSKDGTNWADLQDSPSLFTGALWEPGHTEVVYLRVKNAGTLALKYDLKVSPISETGGINQEGNSFKLSNYIKFATVSANTLTTYTRDTARAAVGTGVALNSGMLQSGSMEPKAAGAADLPTKYVTLVVYMPEEVGNEANYKTGTTAPEIDLGITVLATQLKSENDSFGDTYDDGLTNDTSVIYNYFPQVNVTAQLVINEQNHVAKGSEAGGNVTVTPLTDDSTKSKVEMSSTEQIESTPAAKVETILEKDGVNQTGSMTLKVVKDDTANATFKTDSTKINTATQDSTTYEVKVETEGVVAVPETEGKAKFKVDLFIGKSRTNVKMYHNSNPMKTTGDESYVAGANNTFTYDADTGYVTMYVDSFSPFTAVYDMPVAAIGTTVYYTLKSAIAAAQTNDTISLLKDIAVTAPVDVAKKVTLNLNGKTISEGSGYAPVDIGLLAVKRDGDLTLTGNGKVVSTTAYSAINMTRGAGKNGVLQDPDTNTGNLAKLTVENGEIIGLYYGIAGNGNRHDTSVTINGGTIKGTVTNDNAGIYNPQNGSLVINGGTIEGAVGVYVKAGNPITVTGGTIKGVGTNAAFVHNGNGINNTGDAFVVENCGYPGGAPQPSITGGTFISTNNNAVASYADGEGNNPITGFITGGTFSSDPTLYKAEGYIVTAGEGVWTVSKCDPHVDEDGNYVCDKCGADMSTLVHNNAELKAAANVGGYIKMANDITTEGYSNNVTFKKDTTLDMNGHTLTLGAYHFGTNAANVKVVFKNGNIVVNGDSLWYTKSNGETAYLKFENVNVTSNTNGNTPLFTFNKNYESNLYDLTVDGLVYNGERTVFQVYCGASTDGAQPGNLTLKNCNITSTNSIINRVSGTKADFNLVVNNSTLNCTATGTNGFAIRLTSKGNVTITDSTITGSASTGTAGAMVSYDKLAKSNIAIFNQSSSVITVTNSTVSNAVSTTNTWTYTVTE